MECQDLLRMLGDYVDGSVDPAICKHIEEHMAGCNPCQVVIDNIRKTITLYKQGQPYELPAAFREHLHQVLRDRWKVTHAASADQPPS